ncbi:alpha/beta hydrolase [Actinomadura meridiana]|uniref:Alpha/beta hydrolase n=1 Tax=Actinomadura meridiana TaxID=559626 RepID=A0ABP8C272_9ACTN
MTTSAELPHTIARLREMHDAQLAKLPRPPVGEVRDLRAAGVPARLYRPGPPRHGDARPLPALVFFHGGGWALGDVESYDPVVRALTQACDVAFVSVGYRRPPEDPFPAAVDDAAAAVEWVAAHADDLGVDPAGLGVAGESGGGQIAVAAALRLAAAGGPPLALQLLVHPAVDLRKRPPSGPLPENLHHMIELYLGAADRADPEASPLLAPHLSSLPATVVTTGEFDFLRGQALEFARVLGAAGVETTLIDSPGVDHGYLAWGALSRRSAEAIADLGGRVSRALR